ncbi:transcription factor SPT20 homolog [Chironomus tepperi]|uniref:transcription factor SPT20 homolog n=1 Tax=Chironomus tepperi TaxID=113505 RepID=UPI00391F4763
MSKHHHYHQSQSSGGYTGSSGISNTTTTTTTKSKLSDHYVNHQQQQQQQNYELNEMMMMTQSGQQSGQSVNGMRLQVPNGIAQHNGNNGDVDSNDTNNNYNKHHHNHHHHHHHHSHHSNHRDGKRSASSGSGSGSGEASSSKRTKLSVNNSNNNQSVPSNKYGCIINNHQQHQQQHYETNVMQIGNIINNNINNNNNNNSSNGNNNTNGGAGHYNIMEKLKELYRELKGDKTCKELHLSSSSFLLDKLVTRERLNTLIINLYPGNKGYSLAFRVPTVTTTTATTPTSSSMPKVQQQQSSQQSSQQQSERETVHETPSWLYDNAHLLDALDAEELPPLLIDFCNAHCPHLYYNGAVIAQIRDYRQSYPLDICDIHYVLLRPTAAALWDEINGTVDTNWSIKERTALESQLVLATAPPMCLDPSPQVGISAINSTTERSPIAASDGVIKMAKKFLQVTKNRNNKLEKKTHYPQLSLANHIKHHPKRDTVTATTKGAPTVPNIPNDNQINDNVDISSFKVLPIVPPSQRYDWQARNTERLTFETDRDNCQYRVRVELFERATTCEVSGQLTLERQKSGSQVSGRMCPFKLASPLAARRYVKEFMGIFTEEGRKFVKITHERETRAGREITEMQTGEKVTATTTTLQNQPKIQTIPIIAQSPAHPQTLQQIITSPPPPVTSITSPPPPALVATTPTALKLTAAPQRIITARPSPGQVVVLAQVKQESPGNQVIKNLLNQPRAPMTQSMVNGLALPAGQEVQTVYLQVDNSNLIHMGSTVPGNLQFQQLLVPAAPVTQTTPTYTMNVQTVTPQQVTVVKRHRDM